MSSSRLLRWLLSYSKIIFIDRSVSFLLFLFFLNPLGGRMRLGYVIIYVKEIQESVAFYEKAFGLKCRFIHESGSYAEMETGTTTLAFFDEKLMKDSFSFRPNRRSEESPGIEISLVTDQVEEQFNKAIKAGATSVVKPTPKPWGQLVSYVKDINGCLVELCSPMS
jgi:lactoylglutathione lyase